MKGKTPVVPRPAATVMVVRPAGEGFEVFMVRRHQASKFAADVFVFPGGTVRSDDRLSAAEAAEVGLDPAALHAVLAGRDDPFAEHDDGGLSLWVAAIRELFEEAGVLLAEDQRGALLDLSEPGRLARFAVMRNELQAGSLSLLALARAERLTLAADRLVYFSRWITPATSPRRFDARFFIAELPAGQTAGHCQIETTDGLWVDARQALDRHAADDFPMMFVTREHVKRLAEFRQARVLIEFARQKLVTVVRPEVDDRDRPKIKTERSRW